MHIVAQSFMMRMKNMTQRLKREKMKMLGSSAKAQKARDLVLVAQRHALWQILHVTKPDNK